MNQATCINRPIFNKPYFFTGLSSFIRADEEILLFVYCIHVLYKVLLLI